MDLRSGLAELRRSEGRAGRRHLVEAAARQLEAWAERAGPKVRPLATRVYGMHRRVATALVAMVAIWLCLHVIFGANGMAVYRAKRAEYQNLEKDIKRLEKENDRYTGEIHQLRSDPRRIEKEAREQFHYARPGEVIYVSPERSRPSPTDTRSAHK